MLLDITNSGVPDNIRVLESDPPGFFDQEAMKAAKKWKYEPVSLKNHRVVIDFKLSPEQEQKGEGAK
jgi:protein TonB